MIRDCFVWLGIENLVKITGILTANMYIVILRENLEASLL